MKITVFGSGTSHGIPVVGCRCDVCTSIDYKDKRTRSSILVQHNGAGILVDTSTDFRRQAIREGLSRLDAVLITHAHADHIHGLDDIRSLTWEKSLPVYAAQNAADEIRTRFDYVFKKTQIGGGKPNIDIRVIDSGELNVCGIDVLPIPIKHGDLDIFGYRFANFAYLTDCSGIPQESYRFLAGVEYLIIGALRYRPHATHFSIGEASEAAAKIGAKRTWLTHLCHDVSHMGLVKDLQNGVNPAYDGMILTL